MKYFLAILLALGLPSLSMAVTCTPSTASVLQTCLTNAACGDVIDIQAGTYSSDKFTLSNKSCQGNSITIQAAGWTAPGAATQQIVYIESVRSLLPSDWQHCVWDTVGVNCDCDSTHQNTQIGAGGQTACEATWWYTKPVDSNAYWAALPNGQITPVRANAAAMTATYDALPTVNSPTILVRWGSTVPTGTGVNWSGNGYGIEITNCNGVTIRGLQFRRTRRAHIQTIGTSANLTIQDNKFWEAQDGGQGSARPITTDSTTNLQILDNELAYSQDEPLHIGVGTTGVTSGLIARNWVHDVGDVTRLGDIQGAFDPDGPGGQSGPTGTPNCTTFTNDAPLTGSCSSSCSGAGDCLTGNCNNGHCTCRLSSTDCNSGGTCSMLGAAGNFSGLVVEGNLFQHCRPVSSKGIGILIETAADGMIVRDNVLQDVGACFKWAVDYIYGHANNNQIYSNVCISPSVGSYGDGFLMKTGLNLPIQGNKIYNNTVVNPGRNAIGTDGENKSAVQTNLFRNNLFMDFTWTSGKKLIDWPAGGSASGNQFQYNGLWSQGAAGVATGTIVTVGAIASTCNGIKPITDMDGPTNGADSNVCPNDVSGPYSQPRFGFDATVDVAALDFRLHGTSIAKDAGTMTGMPTRTGINNSITAAHGLPDYSAPSCTNIAATPDIGAYEVLLSDSGFESGSIDGPWTVPNTAGIVCLYPQSLANSGLSGLRSLVVDVGLDYNCIHQVQVCFNCRERFAIQSLNGLTVGKQYLLSGSYRIRAGVPGADSALAFSFYNPVDCPNPITGGCADATCSLQIGGGGDFVCPSFMVPLASDENFIIYPVKNDAGTFATVEIDNLELR